MEKLSIEEKAKAYDEALERAKKVFNCEANDREPGTSICEYIFPVLKETEDEKIRKFLIKWIQDNYYHGTTEIPTKTLIDWLEKQKTIDVLDKEEKEFADNVDSYRKDMDEFYKKGYNAGREAEKQYWLEKQGEQSSLNINRECLKGIKRVQEYQDLSDWEKEFDKIASMYAHNKNQEGYNDSWYVKERAAEMLYYAKKELEKQGGQKPTDEVGPITQSYIIPNGKFFQWIYDRLVHVHNENPNVDYMLSLKKRIEDMQNPANDDMKEALQTEYEKGRADAIAEIQKSAWSCEDETRLQACLDILQANSLMGTVDTVMTNWLKSLKNRIKGE